MEWFEKVWILLPLGELGSYLSTINATLRCSFSNYPSNSLSHSSKISKFIRLFFCPRYWRGSFFIPLKHRGFSDLLMTNLGKFPLFILAPASLEKKFTILASGTLFFFQSEVFLRQGLVKKPKLINTVDAAGLIVAQWKWFISKGPSFLW